MRTRTVMRLLLAVLIGLSLSTLTYGYATAATATTFEGQFANNSTPSGEQIVPARDRVTVIATDSNSWRGVRSDGPRGLAELVAFAPNGSVLYYASDHTRYWDVDPVPGTAMTVEYVFSDHRDADACPSDLTGHDLVVASDSWARYQAAHESVDACTVNGIERTNLSTGETEVLWTQITPGKESTRYHDIDRVSESKIVVADIFLDRVFVVDTEHDRITWMWNATETFSTDSGGPYPSDWTHINDVEVLPDGRIMVSVRNQDQVVFLDRNGTVDKWTLGEEDHRRILYEQHNPDYIPRQRGGPSVLVADSENNRVVEYGRTNGSWNRTWTWRDGRLQWPRDADRLPNGHTLIVDSNGNRVIEVDRRGRIVWQVNIGFPYDAERLGTGDESTKGPSAVRADLQSYRGSVDDRAGIVLKGIIPGRYLNGLMYVTPVWMGVVEVFSVVSTALIGCVWGILEASWRFSGDGTRQ